MAQVFVATSAHIDFMNLTGLVAYGGCACHILQTLGIIVEGARSLPISLKFSWRSTAPTPSSTTAFATPTDPRRTSPSRPDRRGGVALCDFAALIGPDQFREFVMPGIAEQCTWLDHTLFHLDGPDALHHAPALMEIEALDALQWAPGAGNPDGGSPAWYELYDLVRRAGKSLQIRVGGSPDEAWEKCDAIVQRYGSDGLYFMLPEMPETAARAFVEKADRLWT